MYDFYFLRKRKNLGELYNIFFYFTEPLQSKLFFHQTFIEIVLNKSSRCDGRNQGFYTCPFLVLVE